MILERAHRTRKWKRIAQFFGASVVVVIILVALLYSHFFGPAASHGGANAASTQYVVTPEATMRSVAADLRTQGIIRSNWAVRVAILEEAHGRPIRPGGYTLTPTMDAWSIAKVLVGPPQLAFLTFTPGMRKEEMGDMLAEALGWSPEELQEWNTTATEPEPDFAEGVYFPGTYLIPSDQTPAQVAARMRGRFTDAFAPYAQEAQLKGLKWTDVLTLASIVDREASKTDRALVAGILWNRLDSGMKLQADATLQYIKGTQGNWWPQPTSADKYLESAFNTYQHTGLPPHPIDNPSLGAIAAVLDPIETNCLYYLHDADHTIHCSRTYAGQKKNVDTYLK